MTGHVDMTGQVLMGRYLVEEVIGAGGMSDVYKGLDLNTDRKVAIKILRQEYLQDEEFIQRFHREAQAAAALSHEYLVGVHDLGQEDGHEFIVMEYVQGITLKEYIKEQGVLSVEETIRIGSQLCQAIDHAHGAQIIHRDIKPQNILIDENNNAKLTDFGIARATTSSTVTMIDGHVMGSVHYFSPEQAKGILAEEQSDLYSLGVVLFEMATGTVPYQGDSPVSVALGHLQEPIPNPLDRNPLLTPALCQIIIKALAKGKLDRYQNALSLQHDLQQAIDHPEGGFVTQREISPDDPTILVPIVPVEYYTQEEDTIFYDPDDTQEGSDQDLAIQAQKPRVRRGVFVAIGFVLMVCIGLAYVGYRAVVTLNDGSMQRVPEVEMLPQNKAEEKLIEFGFTVSVERDFSGEVDMGLVMVQDPAPQTQAKVGSVVHITVSDGPQEVNVPDFFGMQEEQAIASIASNSLVAGTIYRKENAAPRGTVFAQEPQKGIVVQNGDPVDLYISEPPLTRITPKVTDLSLEEAMAAIRKEGLILGRIQYEETTTMQSGIVFRQIPEAGAEALDGSAVDLMVSKESEPLYRKVEQVYLSLPDGDCRVTIYLEDKDKNRSMYYDEMTIGGQFHIDLNLEESQGRYTMVIIVDDQQVERRVINFAS